MRRCKALFQAVLGPEHALTDIDAARQYLARETLTLVPQPGPLLEPLSPLFCRVHLCAALYAGLSLAEVFAAFVASGFTRVDRAELVSLLQKWPALAPDPQAVQSYVTELLARSCPVVSHSERYRQFYRPSYRVIHNDTVPSAWLTAHRKMAQELRWK
ncbi:MAG: hypothetical protein DDT39_00516 [Firmicutes bacterium]|nr:hypothetical protein [candidate division NPL-UPA2 bacterium]